MAARSGKWCAGAAKEPARPRPIGVSCRGTSARRRQVVLFTFFNGGFARGALRPQGNGTERRLGKGKREIDTLVRDGQDSHVGVLLEHKHKHIRFTQFRTYSFRVTVKEREPEKNSPATAIGAKPRKPRSVQRVP
jgi:hypothetical protein